MAEKDRTALLVKSLDDSDASVKALEDQVLALKEQLSNTGREKDNHGHDKDRLNNSLGVAGANQKYLEATR